MLIIKTQYNTYIFLSAKYEAKTQVTAIICYVKMDTWDIVWYAWVFIIRNNHMKVKTNNDFSIHHEYL